jgi:hypothetical protein
MRACMPSRVAAAQIMEANIALQETEEATQVKRLQALWVKFSTVAQIKFGSKEKGVSWSPQESEFGPPSPGDNTVFTPSNPTPAVLVRGAKYRQSSNLDKLMTQLDKQVRLAATASALATSLQNQVADAELDQASEGRIPHQDPAASISGAREGGAPPGVASLGQGNTPVRSSLFGDLATLRHMAMVRASSADLVSGLSLITTMRAVATNRVSALTATNYPSIPHSKLPENKVEDAVLGLSMFSLSHRTAPGSRGHFWFLLVVIWYLEDQDSKTTMLLGFSCLMDILPGAIDGFALHPLDANLCLPAHTNNRVKFLWFLPSKTFWSRISTTGSLVCKWLPPPLNLLHFGIATRSITGSRRLCGA